MYVQPQRPNYFALMNPVRSISLSYFYYWPICIYQTCGIFRSIDCLPRLPRGAAAKSLSTVCLSMIWTDFSIQLAIACPWLLFCIMFQWSQARSLSIILQTSQPQNRTAPIRSKYPVKKKHVKEKKTKNKKTIHVLTNNWTVWMNRFWDFNLLSVLFSNILRQKDWSTLLSAILCVSENNVANVSVVKLSSAPRFTAAWDQIRSDNTAAQRINIHPPPSQNNGWGLHVDISFDIRVCLVRAASSLHIPGNEKHVISS